MDYVISMLEGIITFISPCLLPMLPIYISYFMGGGNDKKRTFKNVLGFVLGFTILFVLMGAFAGTLSRLLIRYSFWINFVAGMVVVLFGLNFMGILNIAFLNRTRHLSYQPKNPGFATSLLFGMIFSVGWTPCAGAFLGSALMLAATSQDSLKGIAMLLSYSIGLGIPFFISAILLDRLKGTYDFIKKNYRLINMLSGAFLVLMGLAMMTGWLGRLLALLS